MTEKRSVIGTFKFGLLSVFLIRVETELLVTYDGSIMITQIGDVGEAIIRNEIYVKSFTFNSADFIDFDGHHITDRLRQRILNEIGIIWSYEKRAQ